MMTRSSGDSSDRALPFGRFAVTAALVGVMAAISLFSAPLAAFAASTTYWNGSVAENTWKWGGTSNAIGGTVESPLYFTPNLSMHVAWTSGTQILYGHNYMKSTWSGQTTTLGCGWTHTDDILNNLGLVCKRIT